LPRKRPVSKNIREVSASSDPHTGLVTTILVSVAFLFLAAAYNYMTPAITPMVLHSVDGGAPNPDEPAHVLYVQSVSFGRIPVFNRHEADYEAHQPPFYYAFAALFHKISPDIHVLRWAATVFGLALIWVTFLIARDLFPESEEVISLTVILVALLPMNVSLSSSVSNDSAANLVFAGYLLAVGRYLQRPSEAVRYGIAFAVLLALGVWTKSSTLLLYPLTVIFALFAVNKKVLATKDALVFMAIAFIGSAIVSLPWLLRNQHLYGDVFAQSVIFKDLASRNVAPSTLIAQLGLKWYLDRYVEWTFASYWGVFDSMNLFLPSSVYMTIGIFSIFALLIGVVHLIKRPSTTESTVTLLTWTTLTILTVFAYYQYNQHFFQLQGRYLYPALIPLSTAAAVGIGVLPSPIQRWLPLTIGTGLVVLNVLCLSMISGRYSL
jgi:hypothetical protein